ncbi:MAG: HAD family hydrolase [Desulfobia sp.]
MTKIKAVIFDLDGTLLNTLNDLADSMNRVLDRMGHPGHPRENYKYFVGDGIEKLAYRVLPEKSRNTEEVARCVAEMREEYGNHWHDQTHIYEGIEAMLSELTRRSIKLAILSNKLDHFTQLTVSRYFPDWNFYPVIGVKPDIPKKPDPTGTFHIMNQLQLKPRDFLFLGDTSTDMLTAGEAGIFAVGALWGFRTREELITSGARDIIETPEELLSHV